MKGYECASYITLKEWKNWRLNISNKLNIDILLDREYKNLWVFISSYFIWKHSNEGHRYWEKIAERKEPLTK